MDLRWSLDELYTSFESENFINDMEKLNSIIKEINNWAELNLNTKDNAIQKIEEYINIQIELNTLFEKLMSFAELTSSVDAKNEKALMVIDKLQTKITELTKPSVKFQRWLSSIDNLDEIISSSKTLKEHEFYLKEIYNKAKYLLSDEEEILIAKMSNTGSNAWTKLQNILTSTLLVDINVDGEEKQLPLPIVRNMAYDKDPKIRKTAYEAELKAYKKIEESSAACLNGIKGEVLTICEMRGYSSPLDMTLIDSRMDKETLEAMLSAMKESLPAFRKYYKRKAELLGYNNGLPFYELFAPMGEIDMNFTYDEAKDYIVKNFKSFSEKLAVFADTAFKNRWIDAEPREGKRGGAFCSNLHPIKQSRILSNFTGSFSDVITLAHELGHGYHGDCLKDESILNSDYPMPLAETASIFCETIVKNAALKEATKEEAFWILEQSISDAGQVIVDIYSRFLFESNLFEKRKDHALSVRELKELMLNAQKEAYGDGLDRSFLHPYMWVCKPHYYEAAYNFYNFPYAFGLLFATGLYAEYLKKGEAFVEEYDNLLAATGKNNAVDVAKLMGIDIRSVDFWRSSLKLIEKDIEKFIKLSKSL
ncbi:M3 family oligoendopeptidase [Caloranaerobacter ferrireducens]|uniref:M3 family oligoendopeptidase n=1 Tax=Caloranaerobacter ferrireducens TaxID=1323370 RepID=UPI00084D0654|nr:M3 family oligoendopeptidase [Caloranaerobacter ferrireducens]